MRIIKVIVDEMPGCCGDCDWSRCFTPSKGTDWEGTDEYICDFRGEEVVFDTRPDWCPLVVEPEPHTFKNTEVGEPWGKPTVFCKNETLGKWQMGLKESEE